MTPTIQVRQIRTAPGSAATRYTLGHRTARVDVLHGALAVVASVEGVDCRTGERLDRRYDLPSLAHEAARAFILGRAPTPRGI